MLSFISNFSRKLQQAMLPAEFVDDTFALMRKAANGTGALVQPVKRNPDELPIYFRIESASSQPGPLAAGLLDQWLSCSAPAPEYRAGASVSTETAMALNQD